MKLERFRKFNTRDVYPGGKLNNDICQVVKAGNRVYLRGQTGSTLDGEFIGNGDAGAQADQAMKNITVLLEEAGATLNDICKVSIYVLHRAHREAVYLAVGKHLKGVHPCGTGLVFASLLVWVADG